jgi:L-ascorbate metabolism protein UlaG (beta-lactamase superfamily)
MKLICKIVFVFLVFLTMSVSLIPKKATADKNGSKNNVVLQYVGVETVIINAPDGTRIVCDPYGSLKPAGMPEFPKNIKAQGVTISHFHGCHSNSASIIGNPKIMYDPGEYIVGSVKIKGFKADHGLTNGKPAGDGTVFMFEVAGVKIVHLGATGVVTDAETVAAMKNADVVIVNVHGDVTKPHEKILKQMKEAGARTLVPGHYSLTSSDRFYNAATLDEFIQNAEPYFIIHRIGSELEVAPGMPQQIAVMKETVLSK